MNDVSNLTTIHTSYWWKWKFPCIVSGWPTIVTCDCSSTSSETSFGSSSSSLSCSITSRRVILWCLIVLDDVVLGLCQIVLWLCIILWLLHSIILRLRSVVRRWGLMNCGAACLVIISACTLYASNVLSRISSMILQYLSP